MLNNSRFTYIPSKRIDDPYSVSPAMVALPIYAKVNKLEKLQNDLAQIATYGIYAQRDMGHLDIDV
jgi:hypothetical protein